MHLKSVCFAAHVGVQEGQRSQGERGRRRGRERELRPLSSEG